jgi:hypothetical protein
MVDTRSKSGSLDGLVCVLDDVGTADYVIAAIDRTTALMGVQTEQDGDLEYSWSYRGPVPQLVRRTCALEPTSRHRSPATPSWCPTSWPIVVLPSR